MVTIGVIRLDYIIQTRELVFIVPHFIVAEVHLSCATYLRCTIATYRIHYKTFIRVTLLHRFNKRSISLWQVYRIAIIVIQIAAVTKLVYLIAVKVYVGIHFIIAFSKVCLPLRIRRVYKEYVALP